MEAQPYDSPIETKYKVEYDQQMADIHRELVASGLVTPGTKQKVDLALVEAFLRIRGESTSDSPELLRKIQEDLDETGRAEVTLQFILHLDKRMMEMAAHEIAEEISADEPAQDEDGRDENADDLNHPIVQALCLSMEKRLPDALEVLNRAEESGLYDEWVNFNRGHVFLQMGDLERALKDFTQYVDSGNPFCRPTALNCCAKILAAQGRTEEAIRFLASAVAELEAHPHPYDLNGEPDWSPPTDREESDEEQMERENNEEWWSQGYAAGILDWIIKNVAELDASGQVSADLRPALEEVKADVVRLRIQLGF